MLKRFERITPVSLAIDLAHSDAISTCLTIHLAMEPEHRAGFTPVLYLYDHLPPLVRAFMVVFDLPVYQRVDPTPPPEEETYYTDEHLLMRMLKPGQRRYALIHSLKSLEYAVERHHHYYTGLSRDRLLVGLTAVEGTTVRQLWGLHGRSHSTSLLSLGLFMEYVRHIADGLLLSIENTTRVRVHELHRTRSPTHDLASYCPFDVWWQEQTMSSLMRNFDPSSLGLMLYWRHSSASDQYQLVFPHEDKEGLRGCLWLPNGHGEQAQLGARHHALTQLQAWYRDTLQMCITLELRGVQEAWPPDDGRPAHVLVARRSHVG